MTRKYDSMLNKARELVQQENFQTDTSKTHVDKIRRLRNLVNQIETITEKIESKKGLAKFVSKFMNNDEKELEGKIAECALLVNRLTSCATCQCTQCKLSSECRYSCKICPETTGVIFCNRTFCVRKCTGWIITPHQAGTQIRYNVLFMVTCLDNGKHYILLENRVDLGRGLCTYDRKTQAIKPISPKDIEANQVSTLLSQIEHSNF